MVIFVKNDPETQRGVESGATLLHFGNFRGEAVWRGWLAGDRKQHQHVIALRSSDPHTHSNRTRLPALGFAALSFVHPQIGQPHHAAGAKLVETHVSSPSCS